jgi:hypothetical protein
MSSRRHPPARPFGGRGLEAHCDRLVVNWFALIVQIAAVITDQVTGSNCRDSTLAERPHGFLFPRGPQAFFSTSSFIASISSAIRAMMRSLRRFSSWSCLSFAKSLVSMPPYLSRHSRIAFA